MIAKVTIIAALSDNGVIGHANNLPWHISKDLKRFKELTSGHAVVMGRKTFESIGKPLPNRTNFVVTRNPDFHYKGVITASTIQEAILKAKETEKDEVFILGGGEIFKQAMPMVDKLRLTKIHADFPGDTFFPDYSSFTKKTFREDGEENGIKFTFVDLER